MVTRPVAAIKSLRFAFLGMFHLANGIIQVNLAALNTRGVLKSNLPDVM